MNKLRKDAALGSRWRLVSLGRDHLRRWLPLLLLPGCMAVQAGGAELFAQHCAACHGQAGVGNEGFAPPLVNAELWPKLGEHAPRYLAQVLANGMSGTLRVNGVAYRAVAMPSQSHLPAGDLVQVASYVLGTLNGLNQSLDEAQVLAARGTSVPHAELHQWRKGEVR